MNVALEWVKSNVFIVIFIVVMLAALIALPLVASGMNAEIAEEVESRAKKLNELARLEQTQVSAPGDAAAGRSQAALVNEQLLDAYRANVRVVQEDADLVLAKAVEHNQKGRGVLMEQVFPAPPPRLEVVIPNQFYERVLEAYDELFEDIKAGSPPTAEELQGELERHESQFLTHTLAKDADDPLTSDEQRELQQAMTNFRLLGYAQAASNIKLFVSKDALEIPHSNPTTLPSMAELFEWQWKSGIHEDLLQGLADANRSYGSVLDAPVKRVTWTSVGGSVAGASAGSQTQDPRRGAGGGARQSSQASGRPANPKAEAPLDFSVSFTGRTSNPLYDVRYVDVDLIVDTSRIPEVLDALAKRNFITVTRMRTRPADPYVAAAEGYYYGSEPVSLVSLRLETIWFRLWTSPFMPSSVKQYLGVPETEANASS